MKRLLQGFTDIGLPQLPTRKHNLWYRTVGLIIMADQNRTSESYMSPPRLAAVA